MPQTPPQDQPEGVVFGQFDGLKNTVSSERLGASDLERAVNVDLDDAKQLRRRRGYLRKLPGKFHSAFTIPSGLLVVRNGTLTLVYDNYEAVDLGKYVGDAPVSYVHVGLDTYFSSEKASGVVRYNLTVDPWGAEVSPGEWISPVINPTSTLGAIKGKLLGAPPLASALALYKSRIFLANGTVLWFTEPFLYDYVNKTKTFYQYEAEITAIGAVTDGLYVGTKAGLYFQSGDTGSMTRVKVTDSAVLERSIVPIDTGAIAVAKQTQTKNALMCMTSLGILALLDSGITFNLTLDRFMFPTASGVAAMCRQQDGMNQAIFVVDSGGAPSSSAFIGDYADAEIRRFRS